VFAFFVVIHVLICVALILIVLLQAGRGGGLAGAFGAGTAQTIFGGRGAATFLSKATAWLAVGFMVMAILLAVLSSRSVGGGGGGGLLQQRARQRASQAQLPPSTSTLNPATSGDTSGALFPEAAPGAKTPGQQPPAPAPATPPGGQPQH